MSNRKNKEEQNSSTMSIIARSRETEVHEIGTIFVDPYHQVKHFESTIAELMNMNSFQKDYEFSDFARQFRFNEDIKNDINHVLKNGERIKKEVTLVDGTICYMMEMRPYETGNGTIGVLVNFVDVTELKRAHQELAEKIEKNKRLTAADYKE